MPDSLTFQFLDVGMGDGTLVQMRKAGDGFNRLILVDYGEKGSPFTVAHKDALKYLVKAIDDNSVDSGRTTPYVDVLVLTHPDSDHFNKVPALLNATFPSFPKKRLQFGRVRYSGNPPEYGTLISKKLKGRVTHPTGLATLPNAAHAKLTPLNELIPWDTYGTIRTYLLSANWPTRDGDTNPKSIVLMFELDGRRVILPGDAVIATEKHIVNTVLKGHASLISCHGLKLGHHGSNGSSGLAWVKATRPHAIFASGDQVWTHPYCRAVCRYVKRGTLDTHFPVHSYYACGDKGAYFNNKTRLAIGMNLWYMAQKAGEKLTDENTKKVVKAVKDTCYGVQWELAIEAGKTMTVSRTATCVPDPANVKKPFDCTAVTLEDERREELLQLLDALPLGEVPA